MAKPLKVKNLSPDNSPAKAAGRILRTRLKEFYSHWPNPDQTPTPDQLHNLRISGKRLRYSAESLRDFYPDRLTLLIELLKRGQDLLGQLQDCASQREALEKDVSRMKRGKAKITEIAVIESLIAENQQRQTTIFPQFQEIWRGLTIKEFRRSLKAMIARPMKAESEKTNKPVEALDQSEPAIHLVNPTATPAVSRD